MKNYLLLTLLLICSCLGAQINNGNVNSLSDLQYYVRTNNPSYSTAEGSRYLNDEFLPARINGIQQTQLVRFNVPDNIVEVKKSNNEIMGLSISPGYVIKLQDGSSKIYETHSYLNKEDKTETTFFEKIYEKGSFKLYLKENIKFTEAKPAKSGYEPAKPAKFSKGNDTFYVMGFGGTENTMTALPKKRKALMEIFGEHGQAIAKKIKADKLDLKKAADLSAVFKTYFELL